jgi:hypothetical protein
MLMMGSQPHGSCDVGTGSKIAGCPSSGCRGAEVGGVVGGIEGGSSDEVEGEGGKEQP